MKHFFAYVLLCAFVFGRAKAKQHFASGPEKTSLIELYTSEGCSSCPPAERWLSQLRSDPQLWKTIVPVEFHVTFWDNLGWPDRFAKKSFTEREYTYAHAWKTDSVYTPCFVKNGAEWKPSESRPNPAEFVGQLLATLGQDGRVVVTFNPKTATGGSLQAWVALLVSDVESAVKRGENAGRTLRHDFTAIQLLNTQLIPAENHDGYSASLILPLNKEHSSGREALAVWVTSGDATTIVQATGGWIQN
jgi:hypothetical protein